jgi:hypothetical protein
VSEVETEAAEPEATEAPKRGRRSTMDGDYLSTTIRIPSGLAKEVKRIAFVQGSTQEKEITKALESHVTNTKADADYRAKLNSLLSE